MVVLEEEQGSRRLPVVVGFAEAQAIAIVLQNIKPTRPLTHDLFVSFAADFDIFVESVSISSLREATFFAQIHCISNSGNKTTLDARTSDAIALALRFACPIYTNESVMQEAGISISDTDKKNRRVIKNAQISTAEKLQTLEKNLEQALLNEDYEGAARLRDQIAALDTNEDTEQQDSKKD
jgi:bifunctional DNase/RNase